jgi:hypothetical protein
MPRLIKKSYTIDLNDEFAGSEGYVYTAESAKSLQLWARMRDGAPINLSKTGLSPTYDGTPVISKQRIGSKRYDTATFSNASNSNASVSSATGLLSFSSAPSAAPSTTTSDLPFSISFWFKMEDDTSPQWLLGKSVISWSGAEYYSHWTTGASGGIYFIIQDSSHSGAFQAVRMGPVEGIAQEDIVNGEWHHIVFTYDGRGGASANVGMNIYFNGEKIESLFGGSSATYQGMSVDIDRPLYIGADYNGANEFDGALAEFAVFSSELSKDEARAIYNATRGVVYELVSGYLNNPVKTVLDTRDNATGSYPSIARMDGFKINNPSDPFDDMRAIDFESSPNVIYPLVLDEQDAIRYKNNWIATPNISASFGDVDVTGVVRRGVSDQGLIKSVKQRGGFTPFDESRIHLDTTPFYMEGTPPTVLPGFSSPLKDKVQIKIDITAREDAMMSRYNYSGLTGDDGQALPGTQFFKATHTGFNYYNFIKREWQEIGLRDPGTHKNLIATQRMWFPVGNEEEYDPETHFIPPYLTGSDKFYQFAMSPHLGYMADDYDQLKDYGYDGIGCPTIAGLAPFTGSYHATSSQQLDMSQYIDRPFLLEKAVLEIPVHSFRKHGKEDGIDNSWKVVNSNRDIDNYVFFIYRQRNPNVHNSTFIDSPQYCSSSTRFIVLSGSMAFYNSQVFNSSVSSSISSLGLPHTPAFSVDFNMPVSGTGAAGLEGLYVDRAKIEMIPAVPSARRSGGSRFPIRRNDGEPAKWFTTVTFQDYWAGGTTFPTPGKFAGPSIRRDVGHEGIDSFLVLHKPGVFNSVGFQDENANTGYPTKATNNLGWGNTMMAAINDEIILSASQPEWYYYQDTRPAIGSFGRGNLDPHTILPFYPARSDISAPLESDGTVTQRGQGRGISKSKNIATSYPSPYLLFPGDKLVFGMDAGISMTPTFGPVGSSRGRTFSGLTASAGGYQGMTGYTAIGTAMSQSFMKIKSGSASLTLYGSFIKRGTENLFQLNQNLTSDAIHEDIHYKNTVLDQFQIESRWAYTGSYIDDMILGKFRRSDGLPDSKGAYGMSPELDDTYNKSVYNDITRRVVSSLGSNPTPLSEFYGVSWTWPLDSPVTLESATEVNNYSFIYDPYGLASWNKKLSNSTSRSSFFRATRIPCPRERSYDSILPDLEDFATRSGMEVITPPMADSTTINSRFGRRLRNNKMTTRIIATCNGNLNNTWAPLSEYEPDKFSSSGSLKAFPYDTDVERKRFSKAILLIAANGLMYWRPSDPKASTPIPRDTYTSYKSSLSTIYNPNVVNSLFFREGVTICVYVSPTSPSTLPTWALKIAPAYSTGSWGVGTHGKGDHSGSIPHGAQSFLYGIENVTSLRSSAVFRYDRYGQFRDMLEQRKDRRYFDTKTKRSLDAVVECVFVSSSDGMTIVNPYSTRSSNMSQWSTSSVPYFDGEYRNRGNLKALRGFSILRRRGKRTRIIADVGKGAE